MKTSGTAWLLDFGDGRAFLKPTGEGLHIRIEARDLLTFHGIQTILQSCLYTTKLPPGGAGFQLEAGLSALRARGAARPA